MPDGHPEEFDEDMATPLCDLSHTSTCSPCDAIFTYTDKDIDLISDELGISWGASKTIPFGTVVPYLGFVWNLDMHTVAIPAEKVSQCDQRMGEEANAHLGRGTEVIQ